MGAELRVSFVHCSAPDSCGSHFIATCTFPEFGPGCAAMVGPSIGTWQECAMHLCTGESANKLYYPGRASVSILYTALKLNFNYIKWGDPVGYVSFCHWTQDSASFRNCIQLRFVLFPVLRNVWKKMPK